MSGHSKVHSIQRIGLEKYSYMSYHSLILYNYCTQNSSLGSDKDFFHKDSKAMHSIKGLLNV